MSRGDFMYEKKNKISANLVRKFDSDTYRVLDNDQLCRLKFKKRVVPEPGRKAAEDSTHFISFYIEED